MTAPRADGASVPDKPLPIVEDGNRPFWAGGARGELRMQRCQDCEHIRFPIQPLCPRCLSARLEWTALSGLGTVLAKIVYHRAFHPSFAPDVPYNLVLVQLAEGPRMFGNVVDARALDFGVGDAVEVTFDQVSDLIHVPRFRLRAR
jgi:uncharacterized protein